MADTPGATSPNTDDSEDLRLSKDEAERIEEGERRLEEVERDIEAARRTHADTERSWQSGMLPESELAKLEHDER